MRRIGPLCSEHPNAAARARTVGGEIQVLEIRAPVRRDDSFRFAHTGLRKSFGDETPVRFRGTGRVLRHGRSRPWLARSRLLLRRSDQPGIAGGVGRELAHLAVGRASLAHLATTWACVSVSSREPAVGASGQVIASRPDPVCRGFVGCSARRERTTAR